MRQSGQAVDGDDGDARVMMLRRELSPPVFVVIVNYRRPLIASRVSCASARKLFFFQRKEGVGLGKGARA